MTPLARSAAAAALLAVPVAMERIVTGISEAWWGHVLFPVTQLLGWVLVLTVVNELRKALPPATRAGRAGARIVQAASVLGMVFAVTYGATAAVTGEPLEATFIAFGLGFLALVIGGFTWGVHLLRHGGVPAGAGLTVVAAFGLVAIVIGVDPWHDVALLSSYVAWMLVGRGTSVSARARRPVRAAASLSA